VTIHQPVEDVEARLTKYLADKLLSPANVNRVLGEVKGDTTERTQATPDTLPRLEEELAALV
jgi:hypothetical protein